MPLPLTIHFVTEANPDGTYCTTMVLHSELGDHSVTMPQNRLLATQHYFELREPPPRKKPYLSHKEVKRRSARQERERIEAVGGRRHSGSGARTGYKSDGSLDYRWRMENKFTTAASYRVQLKDLHKLRSECLNGQAPVFNVDFQDKHTGETKESWVLVPSKEWEKLVNASSESS